MSKGYGDINIEVEGYDVPRGPENVVYRVAKTFIERYGYHDIGISIRLVKGVPPSSGLGSSGASSAAVAYALSKLLLKDIDDAELLRIAAEGEAVVAGSPHYDNVAASLFGGVVIVDVQKCKAYRIAPAVPIFIAVVIPRGVGVADRKTGYARSVLPKTIDLKVHVEQSSALAKLIYALFTVDAELLGEAISTDFIAEPSRSKLIPYYYELKELALKLGALGFNISGAGPAVFSIYRSYEAARNVGEKLISYLNEKGLNADLIVTKISSKGAEVMG